MKRQLSSILTRSPSILIAPPFLAVLLKKIQLSLIFTYNSSYDYKRTITLHQIDDLEYYKENKDMLPYYKNEKNRPNG